MSEKAPTKAKSIEDLLGKHDAKMRTLFLKVMNAHAGSQVVARSENELVGGIREAIQVACSEADSDGQPDESEPRRRRGQRGVVDI